MNFFWCFSLYSDHIYIFKKMCVFEWMLVAAVSSLHAALHRVDVCCAAPGTFEHRGGGYGAGATGRNSVPRSFFLK